MIIPGWIQAPAQKIRAEWRGLHAAPAFLTVSPRIPHGARADVMSPRFSETGTVGGAEPAEAPAELAADDGRQVTIPTTRATSHFTRGKHGPARRAAWETWMSGSSPWMPTATWAFAHPAGHQLARLGVHAGVRTADPNPSTAAPCSITCATPAMTASWPAPICLACRFFGASPPARKPIRSRFSRRSSPAYLEIMKELFGAVDVFNTEPSAGLARVVPFLA